MKYVVLGPKGTFSELAYLKIKTSEDIVEYRNTIEEVLATVDMHSLGIVPIENTLDGYIQPSLDGIFKNALWIVDEVRIPIAFSLVGNIQSISDIQKLYVQFAAKGQCQDIIREMNDVSIILTESNSKSLESILDAAYGEAAIIPEHLTSNVKYHFTKKATDKAENETRFVIVSSRQMQIPAEIYRVTFIVTPVIDRPGLLYDILAKFKNSNINLTSILSRPTREHMGKYHFFLEIKIPEKELSMVLTLLAKADSSYSIHLIGVCPYRSTNT